MNESNPVNPMDINKLFIIQEFTDLERGKITCHFPVTPEGAPDDTRTPRFAGFTQLSTPNGPVPFTWEIPNCGSVIDAVAAFGPSLKAAFDKAQGQEVRNRILAGVGAFNGRGRKDS